MPNFKSLSPQVFASEQITLADIDEAKASGITAIVNNRPDGEEPSAPQGDHVAAAAHAAGLDYVSIPIGHSGFSEPQIDAMIEVLEQTDGAILCYCRSGTRSTLLWALAQSKMGMDADAITQAAWNAGYDVSPIRPMMDMLAAR